MPRKSLHEVLRIIGGEPPPGTPDPVLTGVTDWAGDVSPGDLFLVRRGRRHSGRDFLDQALQRGAAAVISEVPLPDLPVPAVVVPTLQRSHLLQLARAFYPGALRLRLIGVTGTNGKTTTTFLIHHILRHAGYAGALLGTLRYTLPCTELPATHTTPPLLRLWRLLHRAHSEGGTFAVMEVSSHALDQGRVDGLFFAFGIFLNLTRDHLDYHRSMDAYARAKARLMEQSQIALIRRGPWAARMARYARGEVRWLGWGGHYRARIQRRFPWGIEVWINGHPFHLPLLGDHNRDNLLAAVAVGREWGIPWAVLQDAVHGFPGVPGRMETFQGPGGRVAVVDYAHTPDGIRKALSSLRRHFPVVWIVFGAGGEKDRGKRPRMGAWAERLAHRVILTLDNPRGEDPDQIFADIQRGMRTPAVVIPDRREAVHTALREVPPGGCVLIAGKGHEDYQEIQGVRYPYRDQDVVQEAGYVPLRVPRPGMGPTSQKPDSEDGCR